MGHSISDIDLTIHILHNLPEEYETTIELLENDLENELASLDRVKENERSSQDGAYVISGRKQVRIKGL